MPNTASNHVNSVVNKLFQILFGVLFVRCKVNKAQGKVIPEMMLFEDQSQPTLSVSVVSTDGSKTLDVHIELRRGAQFPDNDGSTLIRSLSQRIFQTYVKRNLAFPEAPVNMNACALL